jgi:hypothetical protein
MGFATGTMQLGVASILIPQQQQQQKQQRWQ